MMVRSVSLFHVSLETVAILFCLDLTATASVVSTISNHNGRRRFRSNLSSSSHPNDETPPRRQRSNFISLGEIVLDEYDDIVMQRRRHHHVDDESDSSRCVDRKISNAEEPQLVSSVTATTSTTASTTALQPKKKRSDVQDHLFIALLKERISELSDEVSKRSQRIRSTLRLPPAKLPSSRRKEQVPSNLDQSDKYDDNEVDSSSTIVRSLIEPLIDEHIWHQLDGTEFQRYPEIWDQLATMGEQIAMNDESNEWIDWHSLSSAKNNANNNMQQLFQDPNDTTIHVWTGKSKKVNVHGSAIPWIKTRSIIPYKPQEIVELLLDSNRVQTYNKFSLGRRDCWVATSLSTVLLEDDDKTSSSGSLAFTKIVKNRVQPPLGAKPMISTTFMHAQKSSSSPVDNNDNATWIVVSRAVGDKTCFDEPSDMDIGRSEMLLGINLLQPCGDDANKCILTAVTHVYSAAIPSILAERVGVKSAIKFVKDIRSLRENDNDHKN